MERITTVLGLSVELVSCVMRCMDFLLTEVLHLDVDCCLASAPAYLFFLFFSSSGAWNALTNGSSTDCLL